MKFDHGTIEPLGFRERLAKRIARPAGSALLLLLVLGILLLRSFDAFVHPVLHCEDGTEQFVYYRNNPSPAGIFRFYDHYVSLLPNLLAYLGSFLPPALFPYMVALFSLLLSGAALAAFSLRRFRFLVPQDPVRYGVCLLLIVIPIGNFALVSSLQYSLWHSLFLLILLSAAPAPRNPYLLVPQLAFCILAAWSNPLSVVCLPLCVMLYFQRRDRVDRIVNGSLSVAIVLYAIFGVEFQAALKIEDLAVLGFSLRVLLHRVFFEALLGNHLRVWLTSHDLTLLVDAGGIAIVTTAAYLLYRAGRSGRVRWVLIHLGSALIFGLTLLAVLGRGLDAGILETPWGHRYFYLQQLVFLLLLGAAGLTTFRIEMLPGVWRRVAMAATVLFLVASNHFNHRYFRTSKSEGEALRRYLLALGDPTIDRSEFLTPEGYLVLDRGERWSLQVEVDPPSRKSD